MEAEMQDVKLHVEFQNKMQVRMESGKTKNANEGQLVPSLKPANLEEKTTL